jgi:hypothetical protein
MQQLIPAGDAVSLPDVRGCDLKVLVKLVKFILENQNRRVLVQISMSKSGM